jgi:O-antigen biosynthesis protein
VRGVTYGTFAPRSDGELFPSTAQVRQDFRHVASAGLSVVRTYTVPPPDVVEAAAEHGVKLLVGLDYPDWRSQAQAGWRARRQVLDAGRRAVESALAACAGRPEVLAISVGNEVPSDLVRLHGIRGVEETLSRLVEDVHRGDREMLTTYCSYPTTEYLRVDGQDLVCFNVFLERPDALRAYLRHLQVVAGDLPLLITELGLSSGVNGEDAQRESLEWQLRLVDESGCAGAAVFSWTNEWAVAGKAVEGWGFGITDAQRRAKPALDAVRAWSRRGVADLRERWPRVSVVVCAFNAEECISDCLDSLAHCGYPDLEVIVCDDGSQDETAEVARRFPFRLLRLPHVGLSACRNAGMAEASGEVVAYLDADAACHPEWPYHLVLSLDGGTVAATGGPNLPVPGCGLVERAVAQCPGNPVHVLVSDDRAEHVPGCNMAFRKEMLEEVGGFDQVFVTAGDDVDVCWRLLDAGYQIAYAPAAQVLHHRRGSVRGFLRQQAGYGRAERMVSGRHPHRFNGLGQAIWSGFIYTGPHILPRLLRPVVYHGSVGQAAYQPVVRHTPELAHAWGTALLPLSVPLALAGLFLALLSIGWLALTTLVLLAVGGYGLSVAAAARCAPGEPHPLALRLLVGGLHVAQPLVRTWGRLRGRPARALPGLGERWTGDRVSWIRRLHRDLARRRCAVRLGGPHHDWDLQVKRGLFVICSIRTAVAWGWIPRYRLTFRPALGPWLAVGAAGAVLPGTRGLAGVLALLAVVPLLAGVALLELRRLNGVVTSVMRQTMEGAGE